MRLKTAQANVHVTAESSHVEKHETRVVHLTGFPTNIQTEKVSRNKNKIWKAF